MTMAKLFDDHLLQQFMRRFYGYGNYGGQYWFIGMEEGGGNSFQEIKDRLTPWQKRGKRELEDLAEYHIEVGMPHFFDERPKLQTTWNKLIRIVLGMNEQTVTTAQVREYQRNLLGRDNGNLCLLELLPLPSPSIDRWLYAQYSRLPYLANREVYRQECLGWRSVHLQQRIREYQPKAVIFYGFRYQQHWQDIAEVDFVPVQSGEAYIGRNGQRIFAITKHPVAKGITNGYFEKIGTIISSVLAGGN